MSTQLRGRIITADADFAHAEISFDESGILGIEELDPAEAPAAPPIILPGFVDLHNHGGNHGAFPTGSREDCIRAARYHRSHGTTTMLASLVSGTEVELTRQVELLGELVDAGLLYGIHLEGPFLNTARCGAQSPDRIQPGDPEMLRRIVDAALGTVRQLTLAPETDHLRDLLEVCAEFGIIASFGHTDADFETATEAIRIARELEVKVTATHLFNAMPPIHHRAPGAVAALVAAGVEDAGLELIADGVHLADGIVDLVLATAADNAYAVTDAMEAAGMPDGDYVLGPLQVVVRDAVARLATSSGEGAIAGGTSTLLAQFHRFHRRHDGPAAVRFTATNAAAVLDLGDELGDLRPGMRANLVLLDPAGEVAAVYEDGRSLR